MYLTVVNLFVIKLCVKNIKAEEFVLYSNHSIEANKSNVFSSKHHFQLYSFELFKFLVFYLLWLLSKLIQTMFRYYHSKWGIIQSI